MADETAGVNGRLLAKIDERTKAILDRQNRTEKKLDDLTSSVNAMNMMQAECSAIQGQRWEAHEKVHKAHEGEHKTLNTKKNVGDGLALLAAAVAAAVGITVKT